MKLKFTKDNEFQVYQVDEDGIDTEKRSYEHIGLIFDDELGWHLNISDKYSGIISFDELKQIYDFIKKLRGGKWNW